MTPRNLIRIISSLALSLTFLYGITQAFVGPAYLAQVFGSPLPTSNARSLLGDTSFQSPLPIPASHSLQNSNPPPPTPTPNSPSAPSGLSPRVYLPLVATGPLYLTYGPNGTAGFDTFGLINADVWYAWAVFPSYLDPHLARMVKCPTPYWLYTMTLANEITTAARADFENSIRNRVWLIYNEPDNPSDLIQCGAQGWNSITVTEGVSRVFQTPVTATYYYTVVYNLIKSNDPYAKIFAGGFLRPSLVETQNWWNTFLNTLTASGEISKVEGVHVHAYPWYSVSCGWNCTKELAQMLNNWYQTWHVGKGLGDRPIWITEIGGYMYGGSYSFWSAQSFTTVRDLVMQPMAWWFKRDPNWTAYYPNVPSNPGYDSMEWFLPYSGDSSETLAFWSSFLETSTMTTTVLGDFWRNYDLTPLP